MIGWVNKWDDHHPFNSTVKQFNLLVLQRRQGDRWGIFGISLKDINLTLMGSMWAIIIIIGDYRVTLTNQLQISFCRWRRRRRRRLRLIMLLCQFDAHLGPVAPHPPRTPNRTNDDDENDLYTTGHQCEMIIECFKGWCVGYRTVAICDRQLNPNRLSPFEWPICHTVDVVVYNPIRIYSDTDLCRRIIEFHHYHTTTIYLPPHI